MKPLPRHILDRMEVKPRYMQEHSTPLWKYALVWLPYALAVGIAAALVANWLAHVFGR